MDRRRDPLLAAGYAIVSAGIVLLDPPSVLAIVIVAPLVLLVPGLSLVMALGIDADSALPGRRLIMSVAVSIAITALGGIFVNAVAPLTKVSWLVWLGGFTCVCATVAFFRAGQTRTTAFPRHPSRSFKRPWVEGFWRWVTVGVAVLLLLAGAATLTEITSRNAYDTPLTELSLQPVAGTNGGKVQLTVANRSDRSEDLRLRIVGSDGSNVVRDLKLPASRRWTKTEPVGASGLSAVLTKYGRPKPIGEVSANGPTPQSIPPRIGDSRRSGSRSRRSSAAHTTPAASRREARRRRRKGRSTSGCRRSRRAHSRGHSTARVSTCRS